MKYDNTGLLNFFHSFEFESDLFLFLPSTNQENQLSLFYLCGIILYEAERALHSIHQQHRTTKIKNMRENKKSKEEMI